MVASVRSVASSAIFLEASGTAQRGPVQAGDLLLAFHSCNNLMDSGAISSMTISGGWTPVTSIPGNGWTGTRIWKRIATGAEPSQYTVGQGTDLAAGTVVILAIRQGDGNGIAVSSANSATAPAMSPPTAVGLEIRYGAGAPLNQFVTWGELDGYDGLDVQADELATAMLAARGFVSSSPLPARALQAFPADFPKHAITLVVPSSGSGGSTPPTPPHFPASTPGKGDSRLRYTVHDFLTGAYRGDLFPFGVSLDKRIGEPGTWRGKLEITNDREGRKIAEMFPEDPADLTGGPGRLVVHTWRSGVLWGIHWLHTVLTSQGDRGNVEMNLQGSTLDAYMLHVSLEHDLAYGDDQIQNARDFISHMQGTAGSNAGFGLAGGVSGIVRPLLPTKASNTTYGRVLQDYARATDGFEWVINPRVEGGSIIRSWEWGSPKLVGEMVHVFVQGGEGGTITDWREERSAIKGGTRWGAIGGTPEQEDATEAAEAVRSALVETPHIAAGWPIIDRRVNHPAQSTDQSTIDDYAEYWANRSQGAPSVFSFDALIGPGSTLGPNSLGESVRAILNNPRYPKRADGSASFDHTQRLIGWELTPADRGEGKDKIKLITEAEGVA